LGKGRTQRIAGKHFVAGSFQPPEAQPEMRGRHSVQEGRAHQEATIHKKKVKQHANKGHRVRMKMAVFWVFCAV
jgi:hypothetical protein